MKNIFFVTGSGRSGTNITLNILGKHSRIGRLGFEERFIVDPDGIVDFYSGCRNWSPYIIDKKIKRLELLLKDLSKKKTLDSMVSWALKPFGDISSKRYLNWSLNKKIPGFERHVDGLINKLRDFSYRAVWCGTESYRKSPVIYHSSPRSEKELAAIFKDFLNKVIKSFLKKEKADVFMGDATWAILSADYLQKIMPDVKFIVPVRDGRDIVASFTSQRWAPKKAKEAAIYYRDIMNRWFSIKENLPPDSFYEFKLEDLVKNPEKEVREICSFLGVNYEKKMIEIDLSRSHSGRWKKDFSEEEKIEVSKIINDVQKKLGYE